MPPADATTSRRGILHPETARRHYRLTRYAPAPDLAHLVERHWLIEWDLRGRAPFTQEVVTHPAVNLAFETRYAGVHGVGTGRSAHTLEGTGKVVGTKFRPGGFHPFLPVPAVTLTDRVLTLADAFGEGTEGLHERVLAAGDDRSQIAVVEAFLRARRPPRDPHVETIARIMRTVLAEPEIVRVEQLSDRTGLPPRALQRLFREYVGVTPKWVLRRVRLHEAAERMAERPDAAWAALALDLGYFDQAHFIHDFKAVVGRSPAEYADMCAGPARAA
jgi:AraC-like DNA-binding protein